MGGEGTLMRSLRLGIALIAILSAALGAPLSEGAAENNMPVAYLLTDLKWTPIVGPWIAGVKV